MKISALEEYGLRCLIHVARQESDAPISAQQIAEREGLSLPYAQKILRILAQGDLIEARRGVNGGYVLARQVERISVGDVFRVLGGMMEIGDICERYTGELQSCSHTSGCSIKPLWSHISDFVVRTLDNISIKVLLQDHESVAGYLEKLAPKPTEKFCPVGI